MVCQDLHRFGDEPHRLYSAFWISLDEKVSESIKISQRSRGVDHARQEWALGLGRDLPCARACR